MAAPSRGPSPAPTPERGSDNHTDARPAGPPPEAERGTGQQAGSDPGEVDGIVEKLEDRLRWVTADLENLRRRYDREIRRERLAERSRVAREWLPVIDNLDLALQHVDKAADGANGAVIAGVGAVRDQAVGVLERLGFFRFDDVGKPFDPSRHEAVTAIESDAPDRTVVAIVRPGYGNDDEVLRPAGVVVSRSSSGSRVGDAGSGGSDAGRPVSTEPS